MFLGLGLVKPAGVKDLALWHKYPPTQSPCSQLPGRTSEHAQERTEKYVPCAFTPPAQSPLGTRKASELPVKAGPGGGAATHHVDQVGQDALDLGDVHVLHLHELQGNQERIQRQLVCLE